MAQQNLALTAFNRGLVSRLGLARADIKRIALSASIYDNWMPRILGSMMLRPGLGYLGATKSNSASRFLPFVFSVSDKALIELTDSVMRIWVADALVTRGSVATAVINGNFDANLGSWTDNDEAGGVSSWAAGGYMKLVGNGTQAAIRDQQITVAGQDAGNEHALRIVVATGPVTLRVGNALGDDSYITDTALKTGTHSLALTPTGNFWIRFQNRNARAALVDSCNVEAAGVMELPTPWTAADLDNIRSDVSADVTYVACAGRHPQQIERRAVHSWSIVLYLSDDGPFRIQNLSPITLTPTTLSGNGSLVSSDMIFRPSLVGALFSVSSTGQVVTKNMAAPNDETDPIKVVGILTTRAFLIILSGLTATGNTVVLEQSFDQAVWTAVAGKSWTANTTEAYTDGLDNQIVYYRLRCSVYASGLTAAALSIATGTITGVCRLTGYTSPTVMAMEVLTSFGSTGPSNNWAEGQWSDFRGWPTAVALYQGRLWWAGKSSIIGSASDAFNSFDPETVGDAGPINRTIGNGPVDTINWILPVQRLLLGADGAEYSCRSSALDEPLTPTNFNPKRVSTQGSAAVQALAVDLQGIYVQRGGTRVYTAIMGGDIYTYDYSSSHLSALIPEIGQPKIVRMAAQRQPDTRVHFVRSDGVAAVLVFDKVENVTCWVTVSTAGIIEDVVVLPGDVADEEDHVYYIVRRTINGATVRYLERWAFESQCRGDQALCRLADAFVVGTVSPDGMTVSGLGSLEGQKVVVWADGKDIGTAADRSLIYTVAGGQITLPAPAANVIVGLYYEAKWQSGKLIELQTRQTTPLTLPKVVQGMGIIAANLHAQGLQFGSDFDTLDDLPMIEDGAPVDQGTVRTDYDEQTFEFPGSWNTDSRVCLKACAPRPCTLLALIAEVET